MEGHSHHNLPAHVIINMFTQCTAQVQVVERNRESHARGQTPPADYGHASSSPVGTVRDFFRYPQGL